MCLVHVCQQVDIDRGVMGGESATLIGRRLHPAGLAVAGDQPRRLRPAQTRHPGQVAAYQPLPRSLETSVLESYEGLFHPPVYFLAPLSSESHFAAAGEKRPDLLQGRRF